MASSKRSKARTGLTIDGIPSVPRNDIKIVDTPNSKEIESASAQIRNVDQLLKAAKVDLSVWEVERSVANKWDVAARRREQNLQFDKGVMTGTAVRHNSWSVQELWQVKVWLRRKSPIMTATTELLQLLHDRAPLLPAIRRPARSGRPRRSLEVSLMDPHIGMRVAYPEGDGEQDLELASRVLMEALEDLIEKARPFGPFEQVFMPFGNDFTHVDTVFHTTTAGTNQPEAESWHRSYVFAEAVAIKIVERLRKVAPVHIYEVPGNHSRMADFTLARLLAAYFSRCKDVRVDASSSPYKFHRFGATLIGFEHGHSVRPIRLAALMANERPKDWQETSYREWHLGDQHRKGSSKPSMLEEQGVSVEYLPGLTVPNEWHRLKAFNHQKRGAMAFVYDFRTGPMARLQHNRVRAK